MYSFVIVLGVWALCFLPKLCSHDLWTVVSLLTQDVLAPCEFQIMPVVRVITREYIRWQKSSYVGLVRILLHNYPPASGHLRIRVLCYIHCVTLRGNYLLFNRYPSASGRLRVRGLRFLPICAHT